MSKNKKYFLAGNFFLIFSFFTAFTIRNSGTSDSLFIFIFIISVCIATDIGGYVFGNIFKGPKLTNISPKKTYSGVVGSYFFTILSSFFLATYSNLFTNTEIFFNKYIIISAFLISTSSQLGDIFISYFKRRSNIKDTGKIIPGHGGILDRIDGMIFAFPFFYILNLIIKF
jgi:phosphatidate cytidylyltransferase